MSVDWDLAALRAEVGSFLAAHHTLSLSTVDAQGDAHAASLLYVPDGLTLLWTSDPASRHSRHLEHRPRVAATIAPDYSDFRAIRGLALHGRARRIVGASEALGAAWAMARRYPFLGELAAGPQALRTAWQKAAFYRLEPERVTWIDNARGFGAKATLVVAADGTVALDDD